MSALTASLNPAQQEAVTWDERPLLVLAGAGSGKTRILTHRIAYLISRGAPSFAVLGVTFTNKAAEEMKNRVQRLVRQDVWISTFHSTCMRILRTDAPAAGLDRNFTLYDDYDQLVLIKECLKELKIDEKRVHPKAVREKISLAKDTLMTSFQYAERAQDFYEESVAKTYQLYEEKLTRLKACDFGDLIMKTVGLFDRRPEVLATWQDRFAHILIDEYQDTNHAQYRLVKLLSAAHRRITVVGDPDQSIYAWRGADLRNILNFEKDYPECGIIRMEQNYRSTEVILDAANHLIRRNQMRKPKALWTERKGGDKVSLFEAGDEKEEAYYVVQRVLKYVEQGKSLADQVVFYRVHAQSRVIEDVLRRFNVPYRIVGGVRFYDRKEIKDLIAYLKVTLNPHDDLSLKRIVNVPSRGIGKKAMETLEGLAASKGISFDAALRDPAALEALGGKTRQAVLSFSAALDEVKKMRENSGVREILEAILERTGYLRELESEKTIEAQARIENIEEFFSVIDDFEQEETPAPDPQASPLANFLESISLMTNLDTWESGTNLLTLMTLHTAKGLEFPLVFMVGMEEGIFPNVNAYTDNSEDLEEERRLCYVGITRAKDKLHMCYARQRRLYGSLQHNLPSRFLTEIPSQLFEAGFTMGPSLMNRPSQGGGDIEIEFNDDEIKRRILFD